MSEGFVARLASGVATTCLCWRLRRRDGVELGVCDHDGEVIWQGLAYAPGAALDAGRFVSRAGFAPGRAAAEGALSSELITQSDLAAGVWDGTRVDVYRVDWQEPEDGVHVWSGFLSEITHGEAGFSAELVSLKAELERPVGRVYSRRCDAVLGDARCGLSGVDGLSCDKRFATCRDTYSNAENFRGFPHMPGADFVLAGPAANGSDGGKR